MNISNIAAEYRIACDTPSDIQEHIPTLYSLARECNHIVEGGVRYVVSSWAFIYGCACRGGTVDSYCWNRLPEIERAIDICQKADVRWGYYDGDWLKREIPENDLLFIDTNHTYAQLKEELLRHGSKATRYIVLHDTVTFGTRGEDNKEPGLWRAVEELVAEGSWAIKEHFTNNNGLTVLEKV